MKVVRFGIGLTLLSQGILGYGVATHSVEGADLLWNAFRFRSNFNAPLNADFGWAAEENEAPALTYDKPFRIRIQVTALKSPPEGHILGLEYRWGKHDWMPVGFSDFPYPGYASPILSVVSTQAYAHGEETEQRLGSPEVNFEEGAGLNGRSLTPVWRGQGETFEWEWPLVIRRFSDGPTFGEDGTVFYLRVVDATGRPLSNLGPIPLSLTAPSGHLGGTFVETPGRLGPYQGEKGDLYFFMEPSETDNRLMAVKSSDFGRSWREVDGSGRPMADDLEGVASVRTGSTIHLIHQVSEAVFYHAFEIGSSQTGSGSWLVDSQSIAMHEAPPTQATGITARSDGSLVAVYCGARRLYLQVRSPDGNWGPALELDTDQTPSLSGPVLVSGKDDAVTLAYTGRDGRGFIRHVFPDGNLGERVVFSAKLGTLDAENGAILPLVPFSDSGETVVVYREQSGYLYERRFSSSGVLSDPVLVTPLTVITDAVDSEQVGADMVLHGDVIHLLFIESESRSIFHTQSGQPGVWSAPTPVVEGIQGSWVRGSVHQDTNGNPVYGFIYDAGSNGGSGFNRYFALPLGDRD